MAIFGALSAKLWFMQIAGSEAYAQAAEENLYTTVKTPAPAAASTTPTARLWW
ncbi:MAG: hypothetical protein ACLSDQ_10030 [Adlercreutzia equolifaciens]